MLNGLNIQITVNAPNVEQTTSTVVRGLKQVEEAAKDTTKSTKEMRGEFVQVAGAFTSLAIGKQILGVLGAFAEKADAVTTGMAKIRSVTILQDAEEKSLKNTILSVSEATGNSFANVAEASKNLLAQSLNPKQVEEVLGPLFKLSKVGDLGVESATNLVVALGNMGVMGEKISPAFDVMLNLSNKSSLNVKDFVEVLTKAGPVAANLGVDFKDLAQTAALLRKGFSSGAEEGTSLVNALTAMTNPKKLKSLGEVFNVDLINRATGQLKPLMQIWQEVAKAVGTTAVDQGKLTQIFGSRTGARVFATAIGGFQRGMQFGDSMKQGKELFSSLNEEANNAGGNLERSFSERMKTMGESVNQLKTALDNLLGVLGGGFASTLTSLVAGLTNVISSVREWLTANPELAATLGTVVGLIAQFAAGFAVFMTFFGAIKLVGFGIAFMRAGMLALSTTMAGLPAVAAEARLAFGVMRLGLTSVGGAAAMARVAMGALWRSLLGPFGLILLLFDVLPMIGKWLGIGASGVDKTASTAQAMKLSADAMNSTANALKDSASELDLFAQKLKDSIAMYSGAFMKKPMVIDPNQIKVGTQVASAFANQTNTPIESILPFVNALEEETKQARIAAASGGKFVVPAITTERALEAHRVLGGMAALLGPQMAKQHKFFEDTTHNREQGASFPNTMQAATQRHIDQGMDVLGVFGQPLNEGQGSPSAADIFRQKGVDVPAAGQTTSTNIVRGRSDMIHGSDSVKGNQNRNLNVDAAMFKNVQFTAPVRVQFGNEADITGAIKSMQDHEAAQGFGQ